ncbi:MAG: hypothetical protein EGQ66_06235 [Coriobacteriaceae bacterium]|nr:hypothetical protein [Coriobacteriaceae bacterium]
MTYEFYSQVYGGGLSEAAFGLALPAATRHVRWLVGGAESGDGELESYQWAVCAAVDVFADFGEGQVGGFALGGFKVIYYEDEGTIGEEIATADALRELVGTSLAFSGVR